VYRDLSAPRRTRSHLCSSGPSDQPADRANHSRTIFPSEIQRITGLSCTGAPCARLHHSTSQSLSLLSPAILSLFSDLPFPAVWSLHTTTEGLQPPTKQNPGRLQRVYLPIWPEKGRDFRRPPKLQVVDSQSSAINDRQYHHHQNPRHQIHQDRPSVGQKSRRKISPTPTITARGPYAPPVAFS